MIHISGRDSLHGRIYVERDNGGILTIFFGDGSLVETEGEAINLAKAVQSHLESVLPANNEPRPINRHDTPWLQLAEQKLDAAHFAKVLKNYATMLEQPWNYEVEPCYDLSAAFDFDAAPCGADFWLWVEKQIYKQ